MSMMRLKSEFAVIPGNDQPTQQPTRALAHDNSPSRLCDPHPEALTSSHRDRETTVLAQI